MRLPDPLQALTVAVACLSLASCGAGGSSAGDKPGAGGKPKKGEIQFPVLVEDVSDRAVEYSIAAVGSVAAFETVAITARVAGAVERVAFQEGESTTTDRVLVEIEPERYRLAVASAKAVLARTESAVVDADGSLARREAVNRDNPGLVRDEDLQNARAKAAGARADLEQAKAALAIAELNHRDALVRAPIAGVLQTREVATGQYVQAGTRLATVVRRDPLLLRLRVPEGDAAQLREGQVVYFRTSDLPKGTATIMLVAGFADPESRLVEVTARVAAADAPQVRPGSFAQVTIPVGSSETLPVIPLTAVRPSEAGFIAFVAEKRGDQVVAVRSILRLGLRTADGHVAVREGLKVGQRLIVRGAEALEDGSLLRVQENAPAKGSTGEAPKLSQPATSGTPTKPVEAAK
jgi:membrane fusion protein, multidrug efflux system